MKNSLKVFMWFSTTILTWLTLSFIVYCLSDEITFKEIMRSNPMILIMLIFGWAPGLLVAEEFVEYINNNK